jgi:integrase
MAHADAGLRRPDQDASIRKLERGMGRVYGTKPVGTKPLVLADIGRIVGSLRSEPRDDRDRALVLLGFAGALRSSELVSLQVEDVRFTESGLVIQICRTDDNPRVQAINIGYARDPALCAVRAVQRWLERLSDDTGPFLRAVKRQQILNLAMHPRGVSRAVQRLAVRAALRGNYSAHSLRAGLATSACAHGLSEREVQEHGRWKDRRSLDRYIQPAASRHNIVPALC